MAQYVFKQSNDLDWYLIPIELDERFDELNGETCLVPLFKEFKDYSVTHPSDFVLTLEENETGEYLSLEN